MKNNQKGVVMMNRFFNKKERIEDHARLDEVNERVESFMNEIIPKSIINAARVNRANDEYWNNWEH